MNKDQFLAQVQQEAGLDTTKEAERWSKAVLTALADLVSESEARRRFITQMPGFLKAPLVAEPPRGLPMTRDAFLQHVGHGLHAHVPEAQRAVEAVYTVLRKAVAAGQLEDFEASIPAEIAGWLARRR